MNDHLSNEFREIIIFFNSKKQQISKKHIMQTENFKN